MQSRRTTALAAFLAAGTAGSLLLAGALSQVASPATAVQRSAPVDEISTPSRGMPLPDGDTWHRQDSCRIAQSFGMTVTSQRSSAITASGAVSTCRHFDVVAGQYGWPLRCLYFESARLIPGPSPHPGDSTRTRLHGGLQVVASPTSFFPPVGILPLRPLWRGLVIDAILFGSVAALLILGPAALRRRIRLRRSLCTLCGYPVGTSRACPECGHGQPIRTVSGD